MSLAPSFSLTGGNPANEFNGTAFEVSHGIVDVAGKINTGISSNVNVTFVLDQHGNIEEQVGTGSPTLNWSLETETEQSGLITSYLQIQQQLDEYLAIQQSLTDAVTYQSSAGSEALVTGNTIEDANGKLWKYTGTGETLSLTNYNFAQDLNFGSIPFVEDDPTIDGQVTFDQQEVATIQGQLAAEGLGEMQTAANGSSVFVVIQKIVQVLDIPAFRAQAGQINLYGDQIEGTGVLNAPISANVTITNDTAATLQIEGITIPQLLGGVYVNGARLAETNPHRLHGRQRTHQRRQCQRGESAERRSRQQHLARRGGRRCLLKHFACPAASAPAAQSAGPRADCHRQQSPGHSQRRHYPAGRRHHHRRQYRCDHRGPSRNRHAWQHRCHRAADQRRSRDPAGEEQPDFR